MRKQAFIIAICYVSVTSANPAGDFFYDRVDALPPDTLATSLKEVTVSGERLAGNIKSVAPVQVINSEQLKTAGVTDISDAMRRLAGVNLRDYGGAGGMKTVSVRGLGAVHTAVVYDGIALSDCQTGETDLSRYTLDNMKSLALYAGDSDDIFLPARSVASSAALYINTFDLPDLFNEGLHGSARFKVGSFGLYNPFIRLDLNKEKFLMSVNGEFIHARNDYPFTLKNGNLTTEERRTNSQMNSWKGELNASWRPTASSTLSAKLYFYDNSRQLPGQVIYYVSESHEHLSDRNYFGQLRYKGRLSSKFSLLANAKFNWSATRYTDEGGKYPGGKLDNRYIQREVYASGALLYLPAQGWAMDYSADWIRNTLSANSNSKGGNSPCRDGILQSLSAKFSNDRISILARLLYSIYLNTVRMGEASPDEKGLSPSLSLSVRPFSHIPLFVRGGYKNILRMPTFNEAYFDNLGSINLKPEKSDQCNLGITYALETSSMLENLQVTCDGYFNIISNKIVALPYNMFLWTMSNLGKVWAKGVDVTFSSTFRLSHRYKLLLSGTWTYQRAEIRSNRSMYDWKNQVAYTPLNSGAASLTWQNPWVDIAIHSVGSGSRYTTNNNLPGTKLEGYLDTGVTLLRKFPIGKNSLEGRVDLLNLFNTQYEIVARYPMPGRSWKIGVSFDF